GANLLVGPGTKTERLPRLLRKARRGDQLWRFGLWHSSGVDNAAPESLGLLAGHSLFLLSRRRAGLRRVFSRVSGVSSTRIKAKQARSLVSRPFEVRAIAAFDPVHHQTEAG